MGAVIAGLTLLQVVQIVSALAAAGKSTVDLIDWIDKRKASGTPMDWPLPPEWEHEAKRLIAAASGDESTAEGFISGTLGR